MIQMETIDCDVRVVGGGISGSVCASVLDKLGVEDVRLLEKSKEIGESHSPKIDFAEDKGLKELMKKYDFPVLKETNVSRWFSPNGEMFELESKISDIWFKRGGSDSFESNVLEGSDVVVDNNTRAVSLSRGKVKAVNQKNDEKIEYNPEIIVDATGNFRPHFSSNKEEEISREIYGRGYVLDKINVKNDIPHVFFDKDFFPGSYLYLVHDSDRDVGYLTYGTSENKRLDIEDLKGKKYLREALSESEVKKEINGSVYIGNPSTLTEDNILFAGDSANLMDPLLNYGSGNALKSGIFAAEAIDEAGELDTVKDRYRRLVKNHIYPELGANMKFRKIFDSFNNRDINCIVEISKRIDEHNDIEELAKNPLEFAYRLMGQIPSNPRLINIIFKSMGGMI